MINNIKGNELIYTNHNLRMEYHKLYKRGCGVLLQQFIQKPILTGKDLKDFFGLLQSLYEEDIESGNSFVIACTGNVLEVLESYQVNIDLVKKEYYQLLGELWNASSFSYARQILLQFYLKASVLIYQNSKNDAILVLKRIKLYIHENYMKNITLKEVSEVACLNPYYFSAYFKKATGQNFKSYLTNLRMEKAYELTKNSSMKTYQIAECVGYNSSRQFADKFRETYGISPNNLKKLDASIA